MATKIEITEDIRRQYGNAISQNQAKACLLYTSDAADE